MMMIPKPVEFSPVKVVVEQPKQATVEPEVVQNASMKISSTNFMQ